MSLCPSPPSPRLTLDRFPGSHTPNLMTDEETCLLHKQPPPHVQRWPRPPTTIDPGVFGEFKLSFVITQLIYTRVLNYTDVITLHHSSVSPLHEGRAYGHPTTLYTCPKRVRENGRVRRWGLGFGERCLTQRCLKGEDDGANDRHEIP